MRSVKLLQPGQLELREVDNVGEVTPTTVKVKVHACGICGSDLALYNGKRDLAGEHYFGHEFSGVIIDTGNNCNGMKKGMRVATDLVKGCGRCWFCRNGLQNYCKSMNDALLPGGFTEETLVTSTDAYSLLSPIPDELDDITASLLEPLNCAYHVAMKAEIKPGDNVLLFGLGAIGLYAGLILESMGAGRVIGANRAGKRLERTRETKLLDLVNTSDPDWLDQVKEMTGPEGPDVVVEATGAPALLKDAMAAVRVGGRIVVGSVYHGSVDGFEPLPIMRKELTIKGAKGPAPLLKSDGSSAVVEKALQLKEQLNKTISVYEYKDALQAFADARSGVAIKAVVTF